MTAKLPHTAAVRIRRTGPVHAGYLTTTPGQYAAMCGAGQRETDTGRRVPTGPAADLIIGCVHCVRRFPDAIAKIHDRLNSERFARPAAAITLSEPFTAVHAGFVACPPGPGRPPYATRCATAAAEPTPRADDTRTRGAVRQRVNCPECLAHHGPVIDMIHARQDADRGARSMPAPPANVVRCTKCNGPVLSPEGEAHECADCGRNIYECDGLTRPGFHWRIRNGWLTSVETL